MQRAWSQEAFSLFVQALVAGPADPSWGGRLSRYIEFFAGIDRACATRQALTGERLLDLFGRDALWRAQVPYAFLVEHGYIAALPMDVVEEKSHRARQQRLLNGMPQGWQRQLLRRYHSYLLKRMAAYRQRGWKGKHVRYLPHTVSVALASARALLRELPADVTSVSALDQYVLEHALLKVPGRFNALFTFVDYLNRCEPLFQKLKLPRYKRAPHIPLECLLSEERVQALLAAWLNPDEAGLRNAVMGLLMLPYVRTAKQVAAMRYGDLAVSRDGAVKVKFGCAPLMLNQEVGQVVVRYLAQSERRRGHPWQKEDYLFPGRMPGQSLSPMAIWAVLRAQGVTVTQLYTTALADYFRKGLTNPKVLVEALGISIPTAMGYWQAFAPRVAEELAQRGRQR